MYKTYEVTTNNELVEVENVPEQSTTHGRKNLPKPYTQTLYKVKPIKRESRRGLDINFNTKAMVVGTAGAISITVAFISFIAIVVPSLLIAGVVYMMCWNSEKKRDHERKMKEMEWD